MRRLGWCALALAVSACGAASPLTTAGVAPSSFSASVTGTVTTPAMNLLASCPEGSAPAGLSASDHGEDVVTLSWREVPGVTDYQLAVERYQVNNAYEFVLVVAEDKLTRDVRLGDGRYRARVRTRVCDTHYGPWSDAVYFSLGSGAGPSVPTVPPPAVTSPPVTPPSVTPPHDHHDDNDDDDDDCDGHDDDGHHGHDDDGHHGHDDD